MIVVMMVRIVVDRLAVIVVPLIGIDPLPVGVAPSVGAGLIVMANGLAFIVFDVAVLVVPILLIVLRRLI